MQVLEAIKNRKSVRAYLDRPVEEEKIRRILDAARFAPSAVNCRPWKVAVVTGAAKTRLEAEMTAAFQRGEKGGMDYDYYPKTFVEPYKSRRKECGLMLYGAVGITKDDTARRLAQWVANYRAFDAPVMMFLLMQPGMGISAYIDCGLFLQSVMVAAVAEGLATCPQAALGEYPAIVKRALGYPDTDILVCGLAMGYADAAHPINNYRTPKFAVDEFVSWHD
jgi:nitroreductase